MFIMLKKPLLIAAALLFAGCTKDALDGLDDIYIPDFSNQWTVVKSPGDYAGFFFINSTVTDSAKGKGSFSGQDERTNNTQLDLQGGFTGINVTLIISKDTINVGSNPQADSTFIGKYDTLVTPHLLRLANSAAPHDSLVLQHG
jgi:hypothetical protein